MSKWPAPLLAVLLTSNLATAGISWEKEPVPPKAASRPLLIFFTDEQSALAREFDEDVWRDPRIQARAQDFSCYRILTTREPGLKIAEEFEVPWVPTILILDREKPARRLERNSRPNDVLDFLNGKRVASATTTEAGTGANGLTCESDPTGDTETPSLDVQQLCAGFVGANLVIQLACSGAPQMSAASRYNIYIDIDNNESTGYQTGLASGADRLIQGAFIYKFAGTSPSEWKWDQCGSATVEVRGKTLQVIASKAALNISDSCRVWVGTQTPDYNPADWAPASAPLSLGSSASESKPNEKAARSQSSTDNTSSATGASSQLNVSGELPAAWQDTQGDAPAPLDIKNVRAMLQADKLVLNVELGGKPPLNAVHVFFNTDGQDQTGYSDGAHPGAEFMIEGNTFYAHKTSAGTGWGWDAKGQLTPPPTQSANSVTFTIPCAWIGLSKDKPTVLWFATTDSSWNTADTAPDSGGWKNPEK